MEYALVAAFISYTIIVSVQVFGIELTTIFDDSSAGMKKRSGG